MSARLKPYSIPEPYSMERMQQRKITRNRELRACTECRKRKLRCDRQLPCAACTRRNETTSCVFERKFEGTQSERGLHSQAEARLEHLEQLATELSRSQQRTLAAHDINTPGVSTIESGRDELSNETVYRGATHWSAMLEDIEKLRTAIAEPEHIDGNVKEFCHDAGDETSFLFGGKNPLSFQEVLSRFLPQRHEADRLVAAYFRAKAVAAPFIHAAHFSRLYRLFWDSPSNSSPLWTSILFSILNIATKTLTTGSVASKSESNKPSQFSTAAAQCLAIGEYHRPKRFAVEALLLYTQAKCLTSVDISPDMPMILSTIVRLATVMGYHRNANTSRDSISTFEKEMRRRTWSLCMQLDLLISFQFGLPSNIQFPTWDTRPPTNLLDSDFNEDIEQLPPAKSDAEPTEILFYIAKHRLMTVFEKVLRHTLSTTDQPADELKMIDEELRETHAALPVSFQPRPMADSITDSPSVIVTRLCVNAIYRKCLCVLHRPYVVLGRQESIQTCYNSASDLVRQFLDIYKEFEPGGQLETERWFMGSITWYDFLLGCTALCLTVCATRHPVTELISTPIVDVVSSLELLHNAKDICEKQNAQSRDTRKVQLLVDATVLRFSGENNGNLPVPQVLSRTDQEPSTNGYWQPTPSSQGEQDWLWNDSSLRPMEDTAWAFMEQFLNLPNEDLIIDI